MPTIDIIILIVFAVSAVMGFRKGLITQVGSVAAIIIGIIACRMFSSQVAGMITPSGGPEVNSMSNYGASILACCIIYIVAYYCVIIVAKFLKLVTHTLLLGPLDHIAVQWRTF